MPYLDPHRFHFLLIDQFSGLRPILLYGSKRKRFVPVNQNTPTRKAFQPILSRYNPTIPSRTYNLPAEFNDFSDIFNTSETQVSATVGLTMDYPKKEILSAKKNSSDVGSTKKNVQVNKPPSSPNLTFVVRKRLTLTPTTKSHPINLSLPAGRPSKRQRTEPLLDEDMSIKQFLKLCRIPRRDYHTRHLFKTHRIHHWALRNVTAKKLSKLRFCYGPAQLILQGIGKLTQKNVPSPEL
ncbi:hypothetical protein PCANC_13746 [Puccinia coronata f. sp. avenae]|uniref:Uncharacterized protein n=1 Tax=Puccinia coronata f. sp. avenae TaxID=200324 RepID=A0A2N5SWF2_9BASI|nr:hypothetical protein PCANC_13746 [Puccinia coronata f. sp. avenae]